MAFGLMTNKWQILQKEMITTLSTSAKVLEACARLHNFVINMDRDNNLMDDNEIDSDIVPMAESPLLWGYLPVVEKLNPIPGTSQIWEIVLNHDIRKHGFQWPPANIERKRKELHKIGLM